MGAFLFRFLTVLGYASSIVGYLGFAGVWINGLAAGRMFTSRLDLWMLGVALAGYWICWLVPSWKHRNFPNRRASETLRDLDKEEPGSRFADHYQIAAHRIMLISFAVAILALAGVLIAYLVAQFVQQPAFDVVFHASLLTLFVAIGYVQMSRASMRLNEWLPLPSQHRAFS